MGKEGKISQYRERLDRTLASPELTNEETLRNLVKNQLNSSGDGFGGCSESVVQRKTVEVSKFLDMLRSASVDDDGVSKASEGSHREWKLKQDNEEFRVMYREGPEGTPLHSLLVEGYVEGPVDACLCVSWESTLYRKWWPQYNFPTFKITALQCLQKVRICEQISLVRMKVTWPLSAREAIVHYFMFEYFQDDLIVLLFNTIDDVKSIDKNTHGFTNDGIPEAKDVVRIEVVGGVAIQKVTHERSYFRTIARMDVKVDFVPPSLINFISRQLIGSGFRLYQKAVASAFSDSEEYSKALKEPLYARIREVLYSRKESQETWKTEEPKNDTSVLPEEHLIEDMQDGPSDAEQNVISINHACESSPNNALVTDKKLVVEIDESMREKELRHDSCIMLEEHPIGGMQDGPSDVEQNAHNVNHASESLPNDAQVTERKAVNEIEEEESEESTYLEESDKDMDQSFADKIPENCHVNVKTNVSISPRVQQALQTLEKAIHIVREHGFNGQSSPSLLLTNKKPPNTEKGNNKDTNSSEDEVCTKVEVSKKETVEKTGNESRNSSGIQDDRQAGSNSYLREVNHNRIAPASPEDDLPNLGETNQVSLSSFQNGTMVTTPISDQTMHANNKQPNTEANVIHENYLNEKKKLSRRKRHWICCFFPLNSA
ncbi:hypothetical protein Patl1_32762 [Pistacia atlantica]|uniref:Uncharacterized protein n=1 Tax=Pistacia atlantica TaxID=434234 RepID=A0ACC1AQW9_9ROSI|nr:hypothetical protein Patl1_32762 [Pistacia atlantica]